MNMMPSPNLGNSKRAGSRGKQEAKTLWGSRTYEWIGYFILIVGLGGLLFWSYTERLASAVHAPGIVQVEIRRQAIQHSDGGIIKTLSVRESDTVEAGDVLITFDTTFLDKEIDLLERQLDELMTRRARLEAERDQSDKLVIDAELQERASDNPQLVDLILKQRNLLRTRNETIRQEISQIEERRTQIDRQSDGLAARLDATEEQLSLVTDELAVKERLLADGLTSADQVNALRRTVVALKGDLAEITASIAENRNRRAEVEIAAVNIASRGAERALTELRETEYALIEVRQELNKRLELRSRTEVRAPVSGAVYGMQVAAPGAVVRPAEPIMFIVPTNAPLVVTSQIDPSKIDQVTEGQQVTVLFSAFGLRKTPELTARINKLSSDIYSEQETGRAYYRAEIQLTPEMLAQLEGLTVIPGMPVDTLIQTGERTPLQYILKPLTDQLRFTWIER